MLVKLQITSIYFYTYFSNSFSFSIYFSCSLVTQPLHLYSVVADQYNMNLDLDPDASLCYLGPGWKTEKKIELFFQSIHINYKTKKIQKQVPVPTRTYVAIHVGVVPMFIWMIFFTVPYWWQIYVQRNELSDLNPAK